MKLIIKEEQFKRIFETTSIISKLNNLINSHPNEIKFNEVTVVFGEIELYGHDEGIDEVRVKISKVYYYDQDVTDFAKDYVLHDSDNESDLSKIVKQKIANKINRDYLRLAGFDISEDYILYDFT